MDCQYNGRWSYREAVGSNSYTISSSSGTFSTAYTSATDSRMSPVEAAMHFDVVVSSEEVKDKKHLKGLVQEFSAGNGSIVGGGDIRVLERWFRQLGVGWVLHLAAGQLDHTPTNAARLWSQALSNIHSSVRPLIVHGLLDPVGQGLDDLAKFTLEAMLRMSSFVDFIALNPIYGVLGLYEKLDALLHVHHALSNVVIDVSSESSVSSKDIRIWNEMVTPLSEKAGKAREAIWATMDEIWTRILKSMADDNSSWRGPQGTSDIHKATLSLTTYIRLLYAHHSSVSQIVSEAASLGNYVTGIIANASPFSSMTMEMTLFLEEELAKKSILFSNQSLEFLFLVNNSYFIWQELHEVRVFVWGSHMEAFPRKIENYIQSYLQVSWAPVLSSLSCSKTFFLQKSNALCKFESEFIRTYTSQKLWKVPDPTLRGRLRNAIVEKVAPDYRKYLEVNNVTTPRITPQELEEMLQELFEG